MSKDKYKWRLIFPKISDPFLNLALEEILFQQVYKQKSNFILRFWNTTPCCVLGRNQYLSQEINENYCKENKIPIIRRITGGGAVYLDLGCLNYSFIFKNKTIFYSNNLYESYSIIIEQVINALKSLSYNVEFISPNSIFLNGKKISGNAQSWKGGYILHHGTLLLKSDLNKLKHSLNSKIIGEHKKAVKSRKVETTNLLQEKNSITDKNIINSIIKTLKTNFKIIFKTDTITQKEIDKSKALNMEKYSSSIWTYIIKNKYGKSNNSRKRNI